MSEKVRPFLESTREKPSLGDSGDFDAYLAHFDPAAIATEIGPQAGMDVAGVRELVDTYVNEAKLGFDLVVRHLPKDARTILEVGAGLRLVSSYLASRGFAVTALEPVGGGFEIFDKAGEACWARMPSPKPERIDASVETLSAERHGTFDFIFSVHVLEHVPSVARAMAAMVRVMAPGGSMAHICPNYATPFDPHFGIPLVPFAPRKTQYLFARRIARAPELWNSVNFITAAQVRTLAASEGLSARFEPGMVARFLRRLDDDPVFRRRYEGSAILAVYKVLRRIGVLDLIGSIPPRIASPMEFSLRRTAGRGP